MADVEQENRATLGTDEEVGHLGTAVKETIAGNNGSDRVLEDTDGAGDARAVPQLTVDDTHRGVVGAGVAAGAVESDAAEAGIERAATKAEAAANHATTGAGGINTQNTATTPGICIETTSQPTRTGAHHGF